MKKVISAFLLWFTFVTPLYSQNKVDVRNYLVTSPERPERERRDEGVLPWLEVSVEVFRGSGTIVYYDERSNTAWVLTCAHVFYSDQDTGKFKIRVFYVDGEYEKRQYPAKLIARDSRNDLAMMTFKPDFKPKWIAIGPKDSPFYDPTRAPVGKRVVVTGRDGGTEPAAYEAFVRTPDHQDGWYLESRQSQSRGGRSGGGVMTTDRRWLVGVNHGRANTVNGIGHGLWMPLNRIHPFLQRHKLDWLIKVGNLARHIPIKNHDGRKFPSDFIPYPTLPDLYKPED